MADQLSGRDLDVAVARARDLLAARKAITNSGSGASRHRAWSHYHRLCRNDADRVAAALLHLHARLVAVKEAKGDGK